MSALLALERKHPDKPEIHQAFVQWLNAFLAKTAALSPDEREAQIHSLESAATGACPDAGILLGALLQKSSPAASLKWYLLAAEKGNPYAMVQAGQALANGEGSAVDHVGAALWFQRAADLQDPRGMYFLADSYLQGKGVAKDPSHAVELLKQAAANKNALAMRLLGDFYKNGIRPVIDKNLGEAFRLFSSASDLGELEARGNLGVLFLNGDGVEKDEKQAVELFKSGAELNNPLCMFYYAVVLDKGFGTPSNLAEAKRWYLLAAQKGFPPAIEWCKKQKIAIPPPTGSP